MRSSRRQRAPRQVSAHALHACTCCTRTLRARFVHAHASHRRRSKSSKSMVRRHEREGQPLKRLLRTLTPTGGGSSHARRGGGAARQRHGGGSAARRWQRRGGAAARRRLDQRYPGAATPTAGGPGAGRHACAAAAQCDLRVGAGVFFVFVFNSAPTVCLGPWPHYTLLPLVKKYTTLLW